jgi:hypothetical protein
LADTSVVHIGEDSPEQVALKLMQAIANVEGRSLISTGTNPANRAWILQTYAQARAVVIQGWDADSAMKERPMSA